MTETNYTAISDGTILLQGKLNGKYIAKKFSTFDEAVEYADSQA